jgi:hypothetical protein
MGGTGQGAVDRLERVRETVEFLCSRACAGRAPGTREGVHARERIRAEFEAIGLVPAGSEGFVQPVPGCGGANVLGRIPGRGPGADRVVIAAAHYDHLGTIDGDTYWGADDNAAAVAILLEAARGVAARQDALGREVWFIAFDGEEPPHFLGDGMGSVHFVETRTIPLDRIDMMVCMDLMGHALGTPDLPEDVRRSIFLLGAERSRGTKAIVERARDRAPGVVLRRLASDVVPALSDYYAFEKEEVPFLFFTCGRWEHYHTPSDTPEKLDYPKIIATADYLEALILELSQRPEQRVEYQTSPRDDDATLESIESVARLLIPHRAPAKRLAEQAAKMRARFVKKGSFDIVERMQITQMVIEIEELVSKSS